MLEGKCVAFIGAGLFAQLTGDWRGLVREIAAACAVAVGPGDDLPKTIDACIDADETKCNAALRAKLPHYTAASYRVEKKAVQTIALADNDAEVEPVPTEAGGRKNEPELDRLSNILKTFNEQFGTLFTDTDRVAKRLRDDIAPQVAADAGYQNARENTPHTARMAHDQALGKVMQHLLKDDTQVYKQFVENESFRRFVGDMVYAITSHPDA